MGKRPQEQPPRLSLVAAISLLRPKVRRQLREVHAAFERHLEEATADDYCPEGAVAMDDRAVKLLEAAQDFADDDQLSDAAAVAQLVRLAGRHSKSLRAAEINSRYGGEYQDFRVANRAQRLLKAALTGEPVAAVTDQDCERFDAVERFAEMDNDAAWEQLTSLVPALADVAAEVDAAPPVSPSYYTDRALLREQIEWSNALGVRLDSLVGPRSDASDVLVRSAYARTFAEAMLERRRRRL